LFAQQIRETNRADSLLGLAAMKRPQNVDAR